MRTTAYITVLPTSHARAGSSRNRRTSGVAWFAPIPVAIRLDTNLQGGPGGPMPISRLIWIASRKIGNPIRTLETWIGLN